jgi:hypothetical protein
MALARRSSPRHEQISVIAVIEHNQANATYGYRHARREPDGDELTSADGSPLVFTDAAAATMPLHRRAPIAPRRASERDQ